LTVIVPSRPARPIRVDSGGRIPAGGTTGQALVKSSDNDYATAWGTATASAAWGSISGNLGDQTDLVAELAAKQDTLVSGTTIKTLNGSTILGSGDLVISASVADGDKGDITVSGSGATWAIDAGAVTLAKMANMATASLIYRKTAGSGAPEVNTLATLKTDLGLTGTNSGDQTITLTGMVTGSGTGSFAASLGSFTKAQLDAAVSDGNVLYVGDVTSNATHTGDVTGATALTIDPTAITGKSAVTAVGTDYVLISDTSDSGNLKKALVSDFAGGGGGVTGGSATIDFGAAPGDATASVAVTGQAGILSGSRIRAWVQGSTADFNEYEHSRLLPLMVGVGVSDVVAGTGFTIHASVDGRLSGTIAIKWEWS
jgi:hypothetical protein